MKIVMLSGGAASFCAAQRVVEAGHDAVLVFCDVGEEDESTYAAVRDAATVLGCDLVWLKTESVWELFHRQKMMGKPGAGHCSRILKREQSKKWITENGDPKTDQVVIGLTWEEMHRLEGPRRYWAPFSVEYPMTKDPWMTKDQQIRAMQAAGVTVPELYKLGGFEHANCGGACVKAGHGQWMRLLEVRPERFARWEENERQFREDTGKDVAILRDRTGGTSTPLPLSELRKRATAGDQVGMFDTEGTTGCGCFSDDDQG